MSLKRPTPPSIGIDLLNRMATDNQPSIQLLLGRRLCQCHGRADLQANGVLRDSPSSTPPAIPMPSPADPFPSDSTNITEVGGTTLTTGSGASYSSETVWNWGLDKRQLRRQQRRHQHLLRDPVLPARHQHVRQPGIHHQAQCPGCGADGGQCLCRSTTMAARELSAARVARRRCGRALRRWSISRLRLPGRRRSAFSTRPCTPLARARTMPPTSTTPPQAITSGRSSPTKFPAVTGYDLCTGWGTPNGTNLINALAGPPISRQSCFQQLHAGRRRLPQWGHGSGRDGDRELRPEKHRHGQHHQPGRHTAGHRRHPLAQRPADLRGR